MYNARDLSKFVSNHCLNLSGLDIPNTDLLNLTFLMPDSTIDTICLSDFHLHMTDIQTILIYPQLKRFVFKNCSINDSAVKALVKSSYPEYLSFENTPIRASVLPYLLTKKNDSLKHLSFKNCMIDRHMIEKYWSDEIRLESLLLDGDNLLKVPAKKPAFRDGLYHLHKQENGYLMIASRYGQVDFATLVSFFAQRPDVKSINLSEVVVDESTINLLLPLKKLETVVLNHCQVFDDSRLKVLKLMLPNLKLLMVNGRNLLERADFFLTSQTSINSYCIFEKNLQLSNFRPGLSAEGKTLTIDADFLKKINFSDLNIFLIHHPEVTRIVLKNINIEFWMAIVLSFCKTCQQIELISCKIKDNALGQMLNSLKDLTKLYLHQTPLGIISAKAIANSTSLQVLSLSQIAISQKLAQCFTLGEHFSNLQLNDCQLDALSLKHLIETPKSIKKLRISNMPLDEMSIKAISNRVGLQAVHFNQTAISEQLLAMLMENASFESLGLHGEKLEMAHANEILKYPRLKSLDLSFSELSGIFLRRIARHHFLHEINLSATNVTSHIKSLGFFIAVSRINCLNLSSCQLADSDFEVLHQILVGHHLKHLTFLNLSQNNISNNALLSLQSIINPIKLDLSHSLFGIGDDFPKLFFSRLCELNVSDSQLDDATLSLLAECKFLNKLNIKGNAMTHQGLIHIIQKNHSLLTLNYDCAKFNSQMQQLIIKKLVLNYQISVINDARHLFNHLFEKLKDESQCFEVLKQVYDDHILGLVEKNILSIPNDTKKLNYIYGR